MKKVMLHVSISMLLVTSATTYSSQSSNPKSYSHSESYSFSGSGTDSASGSESSSPSSSPYNSPRTPRPIASAIPSRGMSAARLNVASNLYSDQHDKIIYSRELSPQVSPNLTRNSKEKSLDGDALNDALNQEQEKQKKRDLIAKNCAHMISSDDESEIARKGIELINSIFSDTETPAATPRNPSPIPNPEIRIFPASGNTTPDKQPSPRISPRKAFADSSDRRILDDVAASLNVTSSSDTSPKDPANSPEIPFADPTTDLSQELCDLLEKLKNKDASIKEKQTTPTDQDILKLKNDSNKEWEEKIKKVRKAKENLKKIEVTKTSPHSLKRSRWIIGSVCILAMAIAIFYAQKVWWSTTEKTA